jgi:hypothetical protein
MQLNPKLISTASEYFELKGFSEKDIDWTGKSKKKPISMKQYELVQDIISMQVGHWCMRNTSHLCQSNTDNVVRLIRAKINEHDSLFPPFDNVNHEEMY